MVATQIFLDFHPDPWGFMIQFDLPIFFQMGGSTNHQLALEEKQISWKTLLKWMIWRYHYFWKHPWLFVHDLFCGPPKNAQSQQGFHVKLYKPSGDVVFKNCVTGTVFFFSLFKGDACILRMTYGLCVMSLMS